MDELKQCFLVGGFVGFIGLQLGLHILKSVAATAAKGA